MDLWRARCSATPRRCRSLRDVTVHGRRTCERVWHKRLPTTSLEQALLDFAAVAPLARVRYAPSVADYAKLLDLNALQAIAGAASDCAAGLTGTA